MSQLIRIPLNILPQNATGSVISLARQRISRLRTTTLFAAHRYRIWATMQSTSVRLHCIYSKHRVARDDVEFTIPRQLPIPAGLRYVSQGGMRLICEANWQETRQQRARAGSAFD